MPGSIMEDKEHESSNTCKQHSTYTKIKRIWIQDSGTAATAAAAAVAAAVARLMEADLMRWL